MATAERCDSVVLRLNGAEAQYLLNLVANTSSEVDEKFADMEDADAYELAAGIVAALERAGFDQRNNLPLVVLED
jgi:hypothetical protein